MKRSRKRLKQTAYHEAGHAVIGRVLTLACGHATIRPITTKAKPATPSRMSPIFACTSGKGAAR